LTSASRCCASVSVGSARPGRENGTGDTESIRVPDRVAWWHRGQIQLRVYNACTSGPPIAHHHVDFSPPR
jgi:hypothetical protein